MGQHPWKGGLKQRQSQVNSYSHQTHSTTHSTCIPSLKTKIILLLCLYHLQKQISQHKWIILKTFILFTWLIFTYFFPLCQWKGLTAGQWMLLAFVVCLYGLRFGPQGTCGKDLQVKLHTLEQITWYEQRQISKREIIQVCYSVQSHFQNKWAYLQCHLACHWRTLRWPFLVGVLEGAKTSECLTVSYSLDVSSSQWKAAWIL